VVVVLVLEFMQEEILEATLHFLPLHLTVVAVEVDSVLLPLCITEETEALEAAQVHKTVLLMLLERQEMETLLAHLHHKVITEAQILLARLKEAVAVARLP
jgi:hypothetical protein